MDIKNGIVSILDKDGKAVGTGFLVSETAVLTCAHVVLQVGSGPGGGASRRCIPMRSSRRMRRRTWMRNKLRTFW